MKLGFSSQRRSRLPWKLQTLKSSSIDASYSSYSAHFASCRWTLGSVILIRESHKSKFTSHFGRCLKTRTRFTKEWLRVTSWLKPASMLYWLTSQRSQLSHQIRVKMQMRRMFGSSHSWSRHSSCEVTQECASNYWNWISYRTWSYPYFKRTISRSSKRHTKPRSTK